jgi:hypothetical protein
MRGAPPFLKFLSRSFRTLLALGLLLILPTAVAAEPQPQEGVVHNVHHPDATHSFVPDRAIIRRMVELGVQAVGGTNNTAAAWRRFIKTNDVVGFRVISSPGAISGTRPAVVEALIESLISTGHPARQIVIWDKRARDLILAGYPELATRLGVRWEATEEVGWDESRFYDNATIGRLLIGDLEFPVRERANAGRKSFVSRLLTRDVTKIIPVTPLLSHSLLGVNGQIASLSLGAVDNTMRFEQEGARLAEFLPEICALDDIYPRVAFGVTDALICQYRGEERTYLHYAVTLNQLRFSTDPVALDALSVDEIGRARAVNPTEGEKPFEPRLYENCALVEMGIANLTEIKVRKISATP